jgi:hypothetical protein
VSRHSAVWGGKKKNKIKKQKQKRLYNVNNFTKVQVCCPSVNATKQNHLTNLEARSICKNNHVYKFAYIDDDWAQQVCSGQKASDIYAGGNRFHSRLGSRLP